MPGTKRKTSLVALLPWLGSLWFASSAAGSAAPERILLAHAGGDAGLFSMVYGSWAAGEIGSAPVTESVEPWR